MVSNSNAPRLAGMALRAVSAACVAPLLGPAVTSSLLQGLGLQALRELELPADAPPPALVLRAVDGGPR